MTSKETWEHLYRWFWLAAGLSTWVHILASYGIVHAWSHDSVLKQTGDESYDVVGVRVPWGAYANFIFAGLLFGYSFWMIFLRARVAGIDRFVYGFLGFIVFNAMVVFKTGPVRWAGIFAFCLLASFYFLKAKEPRTRTIRAT